MGATSRPLAFLDFLPAVFRRQGEGDELLPRFLAAFEVLFEELQDAIEGSPDGVLRLRVVATAADGTVRVEGFRPGPLPRPAGTVVIAVGRRTFLAEPIPAGESTSPALEQIKLADAGVVAALVPGDALIVHAGGLPDLFHFETTPPPQLRHIPATAFAHLAALAAWLDLPLRPEKPVDWNRRWFGQAVRLHPRRATLSGLDAMLRVWLAGDLLAIDRQIDGPPLILTDLTRRSNEVPAASQLGVTATLGVDTVLGEGPPHHFIVDLPTAPEVAALRHPDGLEVVHRAARVLLDREKPAWTVYELRIRASGMELAPGGEVPAGGFDYPYAQIGRTTLTGRGCSKASNDVGRRQPTTSRGGRRMGRRVSYFDRQFLRAEDFQVEQDYHLGRRRQVNAGMFRPGVASGLDVVRVDAASVRVTAGLALDALGREIVLAQDSGAIAIDPAASVEIWIVYAEAPAEPVSYLGADEQRFTRTDEAPTIVPVPPGNVPADGIRLAVVPPGGDPDMSARPVAGPRPDSVAGPSLADDAVTSRALAEADGASDQDTDSGSGVKTGHIQDGAVTSDKLADDVVDGLAERTIEKLLQTGVPIGDRSVTPDMLADDAVSSRALAEAAPGSADQDTSSGAGVKTGHLADQAVTRPKLAAGAVAFENLATERVLDTVVTVPRATVTQLQLTPGRRSVDLEEWTSDQPAFYLIYCRPMFTLQVPAIRWKQIARYKGTFPVTLVNSIEIENLAETDTDVHCVAYRLASMFD